MEADMCGAEARVREDARDEKTAVGVRHGCGAAPQARVRARAHGDCRTWRRAHFGGEVLPFERAYRLFADGRYQFVVELPADWARLSLGAEYGAALAACKIRSARGTGRRYPHGECRAFSAINSEASMWELFDV